MLQLNSLGEEIYASRGPRSTEQRSQPTELTPALFSISTVHTSHSLSACSILLGAFCSNLLPTQHLWIYCSCIPCPTDFPIQAQNTAYKAEVKLPRFFLKPTILRTKPAILTARKVWQIQSVCTHTSRKRVILLSLEARSVMVTKTVPLSTTFLRASK